MVGFLRRRLKARFESKPPVALQHEVRMISGCEDAQTSADVSNVSSFQLPDPAGRAGGACTATLLKVCYADHAAPDVELTFTEVLMHMREILQEREYDQIPQLSSTKPIDVNDKFALVPPGFSGTRRAVMIGINYVGHEQGELSGCHNDVLNMKDYIQDVHGYEDENIVILMDDGEHLEPTRENILAAYRTVIEESEPGDAIFLHYSGHGGKIHDDDRNEEPDGYDEALIPLDYQDCGFILDDELFVILVKDLKEGVMLTCLMDCCHSGSILDLPYSYRDGDEAMTVGEDFDFEKLFQKLGEVVDDLDEEEE